MIIPLGHPLPDASRDLPGRQPENAWQSDPPCRPYLILLPVGFAMPSPLPVTRCALTAPFHPYRPGPKPWVWRFALCGTFPEVAPAGRYPAPSFRGARTFLQRMPEDICQRSSSRLTRRESYANPALRARSASRAAVSPSAIPVTPAGRKWRWKARIASDDAS